MPLHPDDVVRKTFRTGQFRRGYDDREVDSFLEEVEAELRRLYARLDELEAASLRSGTQAEEGQESERVRLERQQLELIRVERASLVEELEALQTQADAGLHASADGDALQPRSDDLQRQVYDLQEELDQLRQHHHEVRERIAASLREQLQLLEAAGDPYTTPQANRQS